MTDDSAVSCDWVATVWAGVDRLYIGDRSLCFVKIFESVDAILAGAVAAPITPTTPPRSFRNMI